jgi:hypothetical protein
VLRIVLPLVAVSNVGSIAASIDVVDVILVEIILVIDVDIAPAMPVAIAPGTTGPGTQRKSRRAPCQSHPWVVTWIGVRVIRISGRSSSIYYRRIVGGNIDHVGLSRLNRDDLFAAVDRLGRYLLLRACL